MAGKKSTETRSIVLELLMQQEKTDQKGHLLLRDVLDKYDYLDARDKAFIKRLAEGCMEDKLKLDYLIGRYASTKNGRLKPVIRNILRMGIYQILSMDSVPDAAACNEAVALAQQKGLAGLKGFVNGVLRRIAREKENLPWPEETKDRTFFLSVKYSVPEWIVTLWQKEYGAKLCEEMLESLTQPRKSVLHIREDIPEAERERTVQKIRETGYALTQHPYLPYAYLLERAEGMERLPGFSEGKFFVQDVSSSLAVELAGIPENAYVVDVCAAPGGKSIHAAIKTGERGCVDSRDLTEAKTAYIRENAERMRLGNLRVKTWDALKLDESVRGKADVLIADLPCSGLGIMGRKGDIRYHTSPESIAALQTLQREILSVSKEYLKPGGLLIFSTCTVNRQENDGNREWLLRQGGLEPLPFADRLPQALRSDPEIRKTAAEGYLQLFPGRHESDGFFISCFRAAGLQ